MRPLRKKSPPVTEEPTSLVPAKPASSTAVMGDYATRILPRLWISGLPQEHWPLDEWGIDIVVTLCEHLPPQAARRFEWGTEGDALGDGEIIYLHWPIEDGPLPNLDHLFFIRDTVVSALNRGNRVLVHCYEGRNRSGLLAALVLRELEGTSGQPLVDQLRRLRRGALTNPDFANYLAQLPSPRDLSITPTPAQSPSPSAASTKTPEH